MKVESFKRSNFDEVKVRASERDASSLAIAQRAQPKFDEVKVDSGKMNRRSTPKGAEAKGKAKLHPDGKNFHLSSFHFPLD